MYRYIVDNAVTYTSEDFVLFKESPFACWIERLTLENPDHGIPPDINTEAPRDTMEPQDDLAETLLAEGKNVVLVEWDLPEPVRRSGTLEAMRHGVDFIVNGQLALGTLSGSANLLMRTSGYSDYGDYLYVPCNTQPKTNLHSALRLCFLADLLHSLQGQLPPQMLIIRGDSDVVPLETEDHIYHYRAVKERFMTAQHAFRKHKMPDPAASAHFGRWSDCANEVLKQRALKQNRQEEPSVEAEPIWQEPQSIGVVRAYNMNAVKQESPLFLSGSPVNGVTLAEQARMLASPPQSQPESVPGADSDRDTLENLSFIGSRPRGAGTGRYGGGSSIAVPHRQPQAKPKRAGIISEAQDVPAPNLEPVPPLIVSALDNADTAVILPAVESVAEAVSGPVVEPVLKPVLEPVLELEPLVESVLEPLVESVVVPLAEPPIDIAAELITGTEEYAPGFERRASDVIPRDEEAPVIEPIIDEQDDGDTPVVIKAHPLDSAGFQRPADPFIDLDTAPSSNLQEIPEKLNEHAKNRSPDPERYDDLNRGRRAPPEEFNDSLNTNGSADSDLPWDD
jgi:hypothetical protein